MEKKLIKKIKLGDITHCFGNTFETIRDKYNRIDDKGVNHGSAIYYDRENDLYYKIFHKDYVRRNNFELAIEKNFFEGMVPALVALIIDDDNVVGYVSKAGVVLSNNEFDEHLVLAIKKWQKENGLKADGLCGPGTHRRVFTARQSEIDDYEPDLVKHKEESFIVHHGNFIPINWPKVVLWSEENGLKLESGYTPYFEPRQIKTFVNHWDVCLNSKTCAKVLLEVDITFN